MNKIYLLSLILLISHARAENTAYNGILSFKAQTNLPHVSLQGKTDQFKMLNIVFDNNLLSVDAVVDTSSILPSVYFSNYQVYENDFFSKGKSSSPTFLKMNLNKAKCVSTKNGHECTGTANFLLAKAVFTKTIKIFIDKKSNATSVFTLSQKELSLKPHHYAGIKVDDQVKIYLNALHK